MLATVADNSEDERVLCFLFNSSFLSFFLKPRCSSFHRCFLHSAGITEARVWFSLGCNNVYILKV